MNVKCYCTDCKHWDEDGGDFYNEGGCTLSIISISQQLTSSGFHPMCEDYKEREYE